LPPVESVDDDADDADDDGPAEPLLVDGELLHAAATTVTVTATAVVAPMARQRMCLTTLLLLKIYSAKIVRRGNTRGDTPRGAYSNARQSLSSHR
jgi:hypothetical protein